MSGKLANRLSRFFRRAEKKGIEAHELVRKLGVLFLVFLLIEVILRGATWPLLIVKGPIRAIPQTALREALISLFSLFLLSWRRLYSAEVLSWLDDHFKRVILGSKVGWILSLAEKRGGPAFGVLAATAFSGPFGGAVSVKFFKCSTIAGAFVLILGSFANALWVAPLYGSLLLAVVRFVNNVPWVVSLVVGGLIVIGVLLYLERRWGRESGGNGN